MNGKFPEAMELSRHHSSRYTFYCWSFLLIQAAFLGTMFVMHYVLHDPRHPMFGTDFLAFWAGGRTAIEHGALAAYSPEFMAPLEQWVRPDGRYLPWLYPPSFFLIMIPLALLPFGTSFLCFLIGGVTFYVSAMGAIIKSINVSRWQYVLAFPGVGLGILWGQNSLLSAAIAATAIRLLEYRPITAGMMIALLSFKPQLGVLFPIVLVCGKHWKALASATLTFCCLQLICVSFFGWDSFPAFLQSLADFRHNYLDQKSAGIWYVLVSTYGVLRVLGANAGIATAAQLATTVCTVVALIWIWRVPTRYTLRAAALGVATLLTQPYLNCYELTWLAIPIAFLAVDIHQHGASRIEIGILAAAWCLPLVTMFAGDTHVPQPAPLVLMALLGLVVLRFNRSRGCQDFRVRSGLSNYTKGRTN